VPGGLRRPHREEGAYGNTPAVDRDLALEVATELRDSLGDLAEEFIRDARNAPSVWGVPGLAGVQFVVEHPAAGQHLLRALVRRSRPKAAIDGVGVSPVKSCSWTPHAIHKRGPGFLASQALGFHARREP
jgi:hypothetical protein